MEGWQAGELAKFVNLSTSDHSPAPFSAPFSIREGLSGFTGDSGTCYQQGKHLFLLGATVKHSIVCLELLNYQYLWLLLL